VKQAKTLKPDEIKIVLSYVATRRHAVRDRAIVITSFLSGMRAHELASLRLGDVIGEGGRIRDEMVLDVSQTKGNHARRVFVNAKLKKELNSYIKTACANCKPSDPLFVRRSVARSMPTRCASFSSTSMQNAALKAQLHIVAGARSSQIWQVSRCQCGCWPHWPGTVRSRRRSVTST
jgi:integrase